MRVIIDTNVLIAAFATQGLCHVVFELCLDQHQILLSEEIIEEAKRNLQKKLQLPAELTVDIVRYLRENAIVEKPLPLKQRICRDQSDDSVLALAQQFQADYIITGDEDLLILGEYNSIPIVSPRKFWEVVREAGEKRSR